jgi:hypothetical protein
MGKAGAIGTGLLTYQNRRCLCDAITLSSIDHEAVIGHLSAALDIGGGVVQHDGKSPDACNGVRRV